MHTNLKPTIVATVKSNTVFNFIMSPIMLLLGYFAFTAKSQNGETFLPFTLIGIGLFAIAIYSVYYSIDTLLAKYRYEFYIQTETIKIVKYAKNEELQKYELDRANLKSFDFAIDKTTSIATITFVLNNDEVIRISEDFGKVADDIFEQFLLNGYMTKKMLDIINKK